MSQSIEQLRWRTVCQNDKMCVN